MTTATFSNAFVDIFAAPGNFFDGLKRAKGVTWAAFALIVLISSGSIFSFFADMSPEWIVEQQMSQMVDASPSEKAEIEGFLMENVQYTGTLGAVFNGIFLVIMFAVLAGFFRFVGRKNENLTYNDWFAFSVWTQFPLVVQSIVFIVLFVSASTPDLPIMLTNYASINQLVLGLTPGHSFYTLTESFSVFFLWSIWIGAQGLVRWANFSQAKAIALSAAPYAICFGLWAVIAA